MSEFHAVPLFFIYNTVHRITIVNEATNLWREIKQTIGKKDFIIVIELLKILFMPQGRSTLEPLHSCHLGDIGKGPLL